MSFEKDILAKNIIQQYETFEKQNRQLLNFETFVAIFNNMVATTISGIILQIFEFGGSFSKKDTMAIYNIHFNHIYYVLIKMPDNIITTIFNEMESHSGFCKYNLLKMLYERVVNINSLLDEESFDKTNSDKLKQSVLRQVIKFYQSNKVYLSNYQENVRKNILDMNPEESLF